MRRCFRGLIFAVGLAPAFATTGVSTQSAQQASGFSGVWQRAKTLSASDAKWITTPKEPLPFQKWAAEIHEYGLNEQAEGEQIRREVNPRITQCFPPDPNFVMNNDSPFEIIESPESVLMIFEWGHWVRRVWINEKTPEEMDPVWPGYSTGTREGDTLVIDTTHIDDKNSYAGFIHTTEMHIVERLRRVDQNTLVNVRTFDDPKAYTKPWSDTVIYKLRPNARITARLQCDASFKKEPTYYGE